MAHSTTLEPGYRPVLVREETKRALQHFRFSLNDRGRAEERRLADAMIFVALTHKELYDEVLERVRRLAIEDDQLKPLARVCDRGRTPIRCPTAAAACAATTDETVRTTPIPTVQGASDDLDSTARPAQPQRPPLRGPASSPA